MKILKNNIIWLWHKNRRISIIAMIASLIITSCVIGEIKLNNSFSTYQEHHLLIEKLIAGINIYSVIVAAIVYVIVVFIICMFIKPPEVQEYEDERVFSKKGELGMARVMDKQRAERVFTPKNIYNNPDNMIIGWKNRSVGDIYTFDTKTAANCNVTVCGCSGTGKTVTQVYPYILQCIARNESFVVTDCSGETGQRFYKYCKKLGYETCWLNFIDREHSDGVDIFQVFKGLNNHKKDVVATANTIAALIAANCVKEEENYFSQSTESFLSFLLVKTFLDTEGKPKDLVEVYDTALTDTKKLIATLNSLAPENPIKLAASTWIANPKQQAQTQTTVQTWMKDLSSPSTRQIFKHDDMSFSKPGTKKCAYFISIPPNRKEVFWMPALICGLMIDVLMNDVANTQKSKALPVTTTFIMDEFPNIFKIPGWIGILNNIRKNHINAVMLFQGIQDMEREYKDSYISIFNACHTNIFCGTNEILTAQFYADWSADATAITERKARTLGVSSVTKQETPTKTTALTADRIKNLNEEPNSHKIIVYEFSQNPFITESFYWEDHWMSESLKGSGEEEPLKHIPAWAMASGHAADYMEFFEPDDSSNNENDSSNNENDSSNNENDSSNNENKANKDKHDTSSKNVSQQPTKPETSTPKDESESKSEADKNQWGV